MFGNVSAIYNGSYTLSDSGLQTRMPCPKQGHPEGPQTSRIEGHSL